MGVETVLIVVGLMLVSAVLGGVWTSGRLWILYGAWRSVTQEIVLLPWTYRRLKRDHASVKVRLEKDVVALKEKLTRTQTALGECNRMLYNERIEGLQLAHERALLRTEIDKLKLRRAGTMRVAPKKRGKQ